MTTSSRRAGSGAVTAIGLWLLLLVTGGRPMAAQSAAGVAVRVNVEHDSHPILDGIAMTPAGRLTVVWDAQPVLDPPLDPLSPIVLNSPPWIA